jgi:hypothetical protein
MAFKLVTYVGTFEWELGKEKPTSIKSAEILNAKGEVVGGGEDIDLISNIVSLTASGHELKFITDSFKWIPSIEFESAITWRGGWAEFIYENLHTK